MLIHLPRDNELNLKIATETYMTKIMRTAFALCFEECFVYGGSKQFYPYISGLFNWTWDNHMINPSPVKQLFVKNMGKWIQPWYNGYNMIQPKQSKAWQYWETYLIKYVVYISFRHISSSWKSW